MCYEALVMCLFSGYCGSGSHKQCSFMISHILACELSYYNIEPFGFHWQRWDKDLFVSGQLLFENWMFSLGNRILGWR